jgi:hypothetical protein
MSGLRARLTLALATLAVVAARWSTRARTPDDYDSVGFVRAVTQYDLGQFQPHFPGYPVYVAATRLLHALGLDALAATTATSALASAATALALWRLGAALAGGRAGWVAFALWSVALGPTLTGGAALSDATATALVAWAFAALSWPGRRAAFVAGALLALTLGARASYWPLALSFAFVVAYAGRPRLSAAAGFVVGTLVWAVPFVAVVGAQPLIALGRTHLTGHFTVWGGSIVTRPDLGARLWVWARDLVYDGLWPHPLALAIALVAALTVARRPARRALIFALVIAAPYSLWVLLGQNVLEQPRHLLPLVAALALLLGLAAHACPLAALALVLASLVASAPLAIARVRVAPASARAGAWVAAGNPEVPHPLVYGMRATRLMQWQAPALVIHPRMSFAEIEADLERLDILPRDVWLTSEVEGTPLYHRALVAGPTFCRDARLDRQLPCVTVSRYTVRPSR